jgi:prophage antirepressor-like protein
MNNSSVQTQQPPTNTVANINNLLVNAFENHKVTIYGTWEEPLFKAKDIGDMLGIKDIKTTLRTLGEHEGHTMPLTDSLGRVQETTFITETGL